MHQRSDRTTGTRGLMEGWHTEQVAESQAGHDQAGLKNVAKKSFPRKQLRIFYSKIMRFLFKNHAKNFLIFRTEIGPIFSSAEIIEADEQVCTKIILDYQFMGPQMEQQIKRKGHFALQASTILQEKKLHNDAKSFIRYKSHQGQNKKIYTIHSSMAKVGSNTSMNV